MEHNCSDDTRAFSETHGGHNCSDDTWAFRETHGGHNCSDDTWGFSERQSLWPPQLEAESSVKLSRTPANPKTQVFIHLLLYAL